MPEKNKNLSEAYDLFHILKERLEFTDNTKKEADILDDALEALNRFLMDLEADKK